MNRQPPSLGCLYLLLVVVVCAAFFWYVNRKAWFDRTSREDRLAGESRYLYRLAGRSEGAERLRWLNEALAMFFELGEDAAVREIAGELAAAGVEPDFGEALAVVPGTVWATGLTAARETDGARPAVFAVRCTSAGRHVAVHWRASRPPLARYRIGSGDWQPMTFARSQGENASTLLVPLGPAAALVLFRVVADGSGPAIRLDHVEVVP